MNWHALHEWLDPLLVVALLLNFVLLGSVRMRPVIYSLAAQGIVLGLALPVAHEDFSLRTALLAAASVMLRGLLIPRLLLYAMRAADVRWRVESFIGPITSLLLGAAGVGLATLYARRLPLNPDHMGNLIVPASLATMFTGFLLLTTRRTAVNQVLGYVVLENGIFIFGLLLAKAMPSLVELGVLLDVFVGVFLMGIVIHHVTREVEASGDDSLSSLRE